ncbi:HAD domain-containing protein [Actinomadura sp. 21ATH]|uniref:HAD domain-containing protein n=1 Tax=Actinomadura sp. 21ATH TaxID=1735444 RepID=UPI0035C0F7B3
MTRRPLLFLDVDGVLNPYGYSRRPPGFNEHHLFPGEEPVLLNPAHGAWITELTRVYDVTWATAWSEDANRLLAPLLAVAPLPILAMPPPPFHPSAKVTRIAELCRHRPAAWIDDQHTSEALNWADNRSDPTLLITIDPATGLTRASIDQALTWATSL